MPSSLQIQFPPNLADRLLRPWVDQMFASWEAPPERLLASDEITVEVDFRWVLRIPPDPRDALFRETLKRMGVKLPANFDPSEFVRQGRLYLPQQRSHHFTGMGAQPLELVRTFEEVGRVTPNGRSDIQRAIWEIQAQEDAEIFRQIDMLQWPTRTELTVLPADQPRTPLGWEMYEVPGEVVINQAVARRVSFPEFEIASNPTIQLGEIQTRRFDIFDRGRFELLPGADALWSAFLEHMRPRVSPVSQEDRLVPTASARVLLELEPNPSQFGT